MTIEQPISSGAQQGTLSDGASRRWVVAIDGSASSSAAIRWCAAHATTDVEVVAVWSLPHVDFSLAGTAAEPQGQVEDIARRNWTGPLRAAGVRYSVRSEQARSWKSLQAAACAEGAELIVIGREHHHGIAGLLSRDEAERLVDHARQPVLVVPAEFVQ